MEQTPTRRASMQQLSPSGQHNDGQDISRGSENGMQFTPSRQEIINSLPERENNINHSSIARNHDIKTPVRE